MKLFYFVTLFTYILATSLTVAQITLTAGPVSCEYKKKDLDEDYDPNTDVSINCNGNSCNVNGSGATSSNGVVTITAAGTYIVKGSLNGQIRIEATKEDSIHLVLDSVNINSRNGPAIYGVAANKVVITLVGDNKLTDSNNYTTVEDEPDACLFIDADLAINGQGSINVTGNYSDAIRCKKDLKLVSGKITIPKANKRGIKAKNSVCILEPVIDITCNDSAIKATRDDNPDKGFVVIDGGRITITSGKDGIHAETHLTIRDGYIDIKRAVEGIEGQMVDILGGEIHVFATNDGINAGLINSGEKNGNPFADFGKGNDGSVYINIVGGKTYVSVQGSELDGIDANGVLYIGGNAEVYSSIGSGTIFGFYAALDSDGADTIMPGATLVATATQSGNGGFWKRGLENVKRHNKRQWGGGGFPGGGNTGGWNGGNNGGWNGGGNNGGWNGGNNGGFGGGFGGGFPGFGGGFGGGMMGNEPGVVYQPYIQTSVQSQPANSRLVVKDSNGNIIISYDVPTQFSNILVTSPKMVGGQTYTITAGNSSSTARATEAATGKENVKPPSVTEAPAIVKTTTTKTNKPKPTGSNQSCSAAIIKQGYPCCSSSCEVVYTDNDGTWGVENGQWCGCGGGATCPEAITSQGYPCCSENNCVVQYSDGSGKWGVENNNWCGILSTC